MTDASLQPFSPPSIILSHLPGTLSAGVVVEWFLFAVFVFWALYTLIAIYHWLKYAHGSVMAYPAISIHLGISLICMGFALSGALF